MTLHRIKIFLAVAKHLSYTRAAQELYISQPAVTKNIQELEQELGARLFNRRGNSIEITPAGKKVYAYASEVNRLTQNLKYELSEASDSLSGNLHIGASSTIAQYLIPPIIAHFKEANPQTELSLISGNTTEINDRLHNDYIELGITEGDRRLNNFTYTPFLEDEIAFIGKADSSVPEEERFTLEALKNMPLAIREAGSGTREVFEEALEKLGIKLSDLNISICLGSTESIKSFVLDTEAVGVFSTHAIRPAEKKLFRISRLKNHPIIRQFSFITKQGADHKLAESFIRYCRRHYNF